jgi:ribosomal protein S10
MMQKVHKIRITLTSRKVQSLEKVCQELIERAKNKDLRAKGPVRLPTKTLKITVGSLSARLSFSQSVPCIRRWPNLRRNKTDAQDPLR